MPEEKGSAALQVVNESNAMLVFGSQSNFENAQRMAKVLNSSTIVPANYQGEKNLANCIIALEMSNRIGMSPLMVMQNLYVVYGNPGWSSKFLIAALNVTGRFTPLRYEYKGEEGKDSWGCRAWAIDKSGERLNGAWVTIDMAKKEGWYSKNGSKWQTIPELMLQYRSGAFFVRAYAPEIGMGLQTVEELNDAGPHVVDGSYVDMTAQVREETNRNGNGASLKVVPAEEPQSSESPQPEQRTQAAQQELPVGEQEAPGWAKEQK